MLKAMHIMCDSYPTAQSSASVGSVKSILFKSGYVVLDDQFPNKIVTLRSVIETGGTVLSECIDSLPSVELDTCLDTILSKMEHYSTGIMPVFEKELLLGIVSTKNIANALFQNKYSLNSRCGFTKRFPSILIFTCDKHLRYSWVYSTSNNFNTSDMIGKTDEQLIDTESVAHITAMKQAVLDTGISVHKQIRAKIKGKHYHYLIIAEPLKSNSGMIEGILGASIDITPLVEKNDELERSRDHFIQLADSIAEICLTLNKDLRVTYWGKALSEITGFPPEKALGKHVNDLYELFPQRKRIVNIIREVLLTGRIARTTYKHLEKIYGLNIYPFSDGITIIAYNKTDIACIRSNYTALREMELKSTAQAIHNDLGQYLSALSLRCAEMEMTIIKGEPPTLKDIRSIHNLSITASDSLRCLTQSILWRAGDAISDKHIIECMCHTIEKTFGIVIKVTIPEFFFPEGFFEREHIVKFIQEGLTNAAKHSGASEISLKIECNTEYFSYCIYDNGCGFDVSHAYNGIGLKMMRFNADELAAEMNINSDSNGTKIILNLPRY